MTRLSLRLPIAALMLLALAPDAFASVGVGSNAAAPSLRIDAKGNAQITYTQAGEKRTVLVPAKGAIVYGGLVKGADVSRPASKPNLPYMKLLRRGRHGWFYALQTWPARTGPVELRFSRWQGAPTKLTLTARQQRLGIALAGKVTYGGKPIPIVSKEPGGPGIREYVYLDQQVRGQWKMLGGVSVKTNGTYRWVLYGGESGKLFRATVAGPNVGSVYAPDVVVQIPPP